MRAIRAAAHGGPEVLRYEDVPAPEAGPGQALVRVEAAGVNFIDVYYRTGSYPASPPFTLGQEGAGVVEAVGTDAGGVRVGDRVAWASQPGSYAELVAVPVVKLVPLPDGIDSRSAAAAMLQGMTAHYLSASTFPLSERHAALVHAAAGGVGLLLVQMARRRGARVIGTVSTEAKAKLAREVGADEVILYTEKDFRDETRRLTAGEGVDVVYDSVGKDTWDGSLRSLKARGMLVLYGASSGPVPAFDAQLLNKHGSLFLTRPALGHYTATREELLARAGDVLGWVASGELRLRIGHTYPLAEAERAHRELEARRTTGKVLLVP